MDWTITLPVVPTMFALLVLIGFTGVANDDCPWLFMTTACVMAAVAYFFIYGLGTVMGV